MKKLLLALGATLLAGSAFAATSTPGGDKAMTGAPATAAVTKTAQPGDDRPGTATKVTQPGDDRPAKTSKVAQPGDDRPGKSTKAASKLGQKPATAKRNVEGATVLK